MSSMLSDTSVTGRVRYLWRQLRPHGAALMLVVACCFWGMGFNWAKDLGDVLNRESNLSLDSPVGPLVGLTARFGVASVVWLTLFPKAVAGWQWRTAIRGMMVGATLSLGLILQHIGLGLSDEPVIAFLTNLTVIFVPLWVVLTNRKWPRPSVLVALPFACVGLAMLSGIRGSTDASQAGGLWGIGCAAAFAAEILLLDRVGKIESVGRLGLMLFGTTFLLCAATTLALPGSTNLKWQLAVHPDVILNLMPLTLLTTLAAFGLMVKYQPKVDPTRAAVIYLMEPLFATAFAWWQSGRTLSAMGFAGAGLILLANIVAEWRWQRV